MTIDVHAHMLPSGAVAAVRSGRTWHGLDFSIEASGDIMLRGRGGSSYRFNSLYWEAPGDRARRMAASGLALQLVSITGPLLGHGLDASEATAMAREINDELVDYAAADPRLLGLASLPLQDASAAVDELERTHALGLPGAVVRAQVDGENWDSERLFPVLQTAAVLNMLVFVHPDPWTGITDLGPFHIPDVIGQSGQLAVATAAFVFGGVLDRLPELEVCMAQAGGFAPFVAGRFDQAFRLWRESQRVLSVPSEYLRRLLFDCMTFNADALACLLRVAGAERVVAGTDHPSVQALANPEAWLRACGVAPNDMAMILSSNLAATRALQGRSISA